MNRRSFLAALAAPLIAAPTLEQVERLAWRRRFWPGWRPRPANSILTPELLTREALRLLEGNLSFARTINDQYVCYFVPKAGETLHVRRPQRFVSG